MFNRLRTETNAVFYELMQWSSCVTAKPRDASDYL